MNKPWTEIPLSQDSYCRLCGKKMEKGEVVEWRPSMGHLHLEFCLNKNDRPKQHHKL
jgi:hypothetical protein